MGKATHVPAQGRLSASGQYLPKSGGCMATSRSGRACPHPRATKLMPYCKGCMKKGDPSLKAVKHPRFGKILVATRNLPKGYYVAWWGKLCKNKKHVPYKRMEWALETSKGMVDAVPFNGSLLKYCACPGPSELPTIDFAPNSDVLLKSGVRLLRTRATAVTSAATIEEEVEEDVASSRRPRLRLDKDDAGNLQKLMVTTPLFYANGSPHIGSAYPAIAADVMARYGKLREAEVHYVTGMDEHGEKIARTAAGQDKTPQELVDGIATEFQDLWDLLKVQPDHFARTTPAKHKEIVHEMWQRCLDNGDIYKKDYSGFYCVGCEAYLDEDEMSEGHICKIHQKECEWRSEENYFFRLSKYWGAVRQHLEENPDFILPTSRRSQVLVWLEEDNKRDFSISRASTSWGIPVPGDDSQVIYVWFDALLGYLSSLLGPEDPATLDTVLQRGWPAHVHVIGKDIMRFHAIYWPAMLMSAGLPLPKHICTHGFLTKDGLKMGKSLGNVVEPIPLVNDFGSDAVRFFFSSCLSFGLDGDFSYETFIKRVNSSLANELGNLVHRILTLLRKNLADPASPLDLVDDGAVFDDHPVRTAAEKAPEAVAACYEQTDIPKAVATALEIATVANVRMNEVEPWAKLKKNTSDEEKSLALRELLVMAEGVRICAVLLSPVTPGLSAKILAEFGLGQGQLSWKDTAWRWDVIPGSVGPKPTPVFQRIDLEAWQGK